MTNFFSPFSFKSAEIDRSLFRLEVPAVTKKEDLEKSENYIQIAKSNKVLKARDIIEVIRDDGAFFAVLFVTGRVNDNILIKIISFTDLQSEQKESDLIEVLFKGPVRKWSVIRKIDNKELKSGFSSKEEALNWFKEF